MNDFNFRCEQYCAKENGDVLHYFLQVVYSENEIITIPVQPKEIVSHSSMKRVLLERNIFYSTTKKQHEKVLDQIFSVQPELI